MSAPITPDRARAEAWLAEALGVPRGTLDRLAAFEALLVAESAQQNLISASTLPTLWWRHFVDSAQLLPHAPQIPGAWMDIGSGAGLPGLILAILDPRPILLVEPRKRRADFLTRVADALDLTHVTVHATKAESVPTQPVAIISARAVASLDALFAMAGRFATPQTRWVLPKGRSAQDELASARQTWQGHFTTVPSVTDADAAIVLAEHVRRRTP